MYSTINFTLHLLFLQESVDSAVPSLVALDSSMAGFSRDLDLLDTTNNRTVDTAHVFYVQSGQSAPQDIMANVVSNNDLMLHL